MAVALANAMAMPIRQWACHCQGHAPPRPQPRPPTLPPPPTRYNRSTELKPHADKQNRLAYQHDPRSRYVNLPADLPPPPLEFGNVYKI